MEALTRMVVDSLVRHGLDRPVDPRRLQWSRWSRCDSPHSLLVVPSKPGIFALAEEVMDLAASNAQVGAAAQACPDQGRRDCSAEQGSRVVASPITAEGSTDREGHDRSRAEETAKADAASAADVSQRRMLSVLQFSEDDDMAFVLDRMFTRINPMRDRLASGRCFLRFVVIEDQSQRRSICAALNQWMLSSAEKASGLPPDFSSSLEMASVTRTCPERQPKGPSPESAASTPKSAQAAQPILRPDFPYPAPSIDSGAAKNLHCPHPLPSGF